MLTNASPTRVMLGLAALTAIVFCAGVKLSSMTRPEVDVYRQRAVIAEMVAMAAKTNGPEFDEYLATVVQRHRDLVAARVVRADGTVIAAAGDFKADDMEANDAIDRSRPADNEQNSSLRSTNVAVSVDTEGENRRHVELRFIASSWSVLGVHFPPIVRSIVWITAGTLLVFLVIRRLLAGLASSDDVPEHIRRTLDTLAEGLVVVNDSGHVVLANRAFGELCEVDVDECKGTALAELPWQIVGGEQSPAALPWLRSLALNQPVVSTTLQLPLADANGERVVTLLVNATPIAHDSKHENQRCDCRVIVSFDDITPLEAKKRQLSDMLSSVRESTNEIKRQNEELERLATRDSLTGCINRRRMFELFETEWKSATRHGHRLACAMIDLDHFKAVNDNHGHLIGDKVLARVAAALRVAARDTDVVARFGGEEFCVLLTHTDIDHAEAAAERFRVAIAELELPETSVTASIGVSEIAFGATDPQCLIDQADRALYAAKRAGRNFVVRYDAIPANASHRLPVEHTSLDGFAPVSQNIPFHAVTALISTLAYRDQETAAHCRRVADLAVATAEGLIGVTDCYTLEIAALLHDLGKIGVPDQILLKPGRLSDDEWAIMRRHDRIGVEIVRASFAYSPLTEIVSQYRTPFHLGGANLTLGARVLAIVDAYDSMTTNRPYRKGRTRDEAFEELRRCSDIQFDPELVERFIEVVQEGGGTIDASVSVAKETALSIGLQIEHLATALDDQDLERLGALASRLRTVAERYGVSPLAEQAEGLARAVSDESDLIDVLQSANELLRVCRSTQKSYIDGDGMEVAR